MFMRVVSPRSRCPSPASAGLSRKMCPMTVVPHSLVRVGVSTQAESRPCCQRHFFLPHLFSPSVVHAQQASDGPIEASVEDSNQKKVMQEFSRARYFLFLCFFGFGYVLTMLPEVGRKTGLSVTGGWKYALIATHAVSFVLLPVAMRVFYEAASVLKLARSASFATQLGFAFIMVSIASEIGWHVTQSWFYTNDFTLLNFMFYFFLICGFSLWADGLRTKRDRVNLVIDRVFAAGLLVSSVLYPIGATVGDGRFKIPIFLTLTFILGVVTYRGYKVLDDDKRILWFPTLSIGVNLGFIALLNTLGKDDVAMNALFHILHDLLGTLAGVFVVTWLVYEKISKKHTEK